MGGRKSITMPAMHASRDATTLLISDFEHTLIFLLDSEYKNTYKHHHRVTC
jgi:hypothetical protein